MSKRKSRLAQRKPIKSMGRLAADVSKFNKKDATWVRGVSYAEISPGRTLAVVKLTCDHEFLLQAPGLIFWPDTLPSSMECVSCRFEAANLITEYEQ